eukprot:gene5574-6940_t
MNAVEYFYSSFFNRGGMYFRGSINVDQFIEALNETLMDFNFMFIQWDRDKNIGIYPSATTNFIQNKKNNINCHIVRLELEYRKEKIENCCSSGFDHLPTKNIDDRMKGFAMSLDGLPMATFKLSTFSNGFTIGFGRNSDRMLLKKPDIRNLDFLYLDTKTIDLKDLSEVRKFGDKLNYFYKDEGGSTVPESILLGLIFNTEEIRKFKQQTPEYISTNDVIHAILLKIYSFNPLFTPDQDFCMKYMVNMRKLCSMYEEVIGNIAYGHCFVIKIEEMRSKSLLELALINRKYFSQLNLEGFKVEVTWMKYLQKYNENPLEYLEKKNLVGCRVSNWNTFNYDSIKFNSSSGSKEIDDESSPPFAIYCPSLATHSNLNMLTFDNSFGPKTIITSIYIPSSCLNSIQDLEKSTNLFTFKQI